jgi:hypothetical protein
MKPAAPIAYLGVPLLARITGAVRYRNIWIRELATTDPVMRTSLTH